MRDEETRERRRSELESNERRERETGDEETGNFAISTFVFCDLRLTEGETHNRDA